MEDVSLADKSTCSECGQSAFGQDRIMERPVVFTIGFVTGTLSTLIVIVLVALVLHVHVSRRNTAVEQPSPLPSLGTCAFASSYSYWTLDGVRPDGPALRVLHAPTAEACFEACQNTNGCCYWMLRTTEGAAANCWLKARAVGWRKWPARMGGIGPRPPIHVEDNDRR